MFFRFCITANNFKIILELRYYLVTSYVNGFPYFNTCAVVDDFFYRINNLEKFLTDGKSV